MSAFHVVEHTVPGQHIREYPRGLSGSQDGVLKLAVNQYIPKDNLNPQAGDVTILGAHATGFVKELYEPLWESILARAKQQGFRIRGIWIADTAHQGQSSVLNERLLGNDPSWFDLSRDLLYLVNHFRDQMPRPLVGLGHSGGGNSITNLAYMHPRLFTTLILIEPIIYAFPRIPPQSELSPARLSTFRRDVWPSREQAGKLFRASKFYQKWHPWVLDRFISHGLRDMPTLFHPATPKSGVAPQVTLRTPVAQEVFTYFRPNYEGYGHNGKPINRTTHADLDPTSPVIFPFYRGEAGQVHIRLPELRPGALFIFGGESDLGAPGNVRDKLDRTGVGVGGSGGAAVGKVKCTVFDGIGHLAAMEAVDKTADEASKWIGGAMEVWRLEEAEHDENWIQKPTLEKQTISEEWKKSIGGLPGRQPRTSKI
ncbi:uncharacterized protein A1O9_12708 [Exophiala aquamarina CBS 119918]|uniref:Uncharacterized protein n=1 Tax=Exophiala aquamarina CBS 119918 TaxID=1182545 RepID=A0A072P6G5_9EURO|nr:uncharacterized protein A1O9_12708 [Exophiala aquamarina CBS 119918]KEF51205.1 hypothetical protein A1O9_12708 [Exophiala aquamarina CBS 119918]